MTYMSRNSRYQTNQSELVGRLVEKETVAHKFFPAVIYKSSSSEDVILQLLMREGTSSVSRDVEKREDGPAVA